jgi:hypothetical protein
MYNISLFGIVTMNSFSQQIYPNKKINGKKKKEESSLPKGKNKKYCLNDLTQDIQKIKSLRK